MKINLRGNIYLMLQDLLKITHTEEQLKARTCELAADISRDYADKNPLFIGVLKGAYIFMAELCKNVTIPCEMAFISASSYRGTQTTGCVSAQTDGLPDLSGRHVILVEDILDTGLTLSHICKVLSSRGTASLEICSMMDKPSRRKTELKGKYVGFEIPDEFVVGFGLDFNEKYRNLPFVGVLKPEVYES